MLLVDEIPHAIRPVAVLGNGALFRHVASFAPGLPGFALAFEREHGWKLGALARADPRQERGRLVALAIRLGDLPMLERLHTHARLMGAHVHPKLDFAQALYVAATQGNMAIAAWLHRHTAVTCPGHTLRHVATLGDLAMVAWLAAHRPESYVDLPHKPCDAIVLTGNAELVGFLLERFPALRLTTDAMDLAAAQGYLDLVRLLHERRPEGCTTEAMDHAARCGRLDLVEFLHGHRPEGCTPRAMDYAAANGHLPIVEFLHRHRTEGCTVSAMDDAACHGHLEVVRFLHHHRHEGCTTYAMDMAAWHRHLDVLEFLHGHRRESCTPMAMGRAAELGFLDVVRFLHEHQRGEGNCHEDALHEAARFGRLDVVQYLVEHCTKGCLFTARAWAEERGSERVVSYLSKWIRPGVAHCRAGLHELEDPGRRCQRISYNKPQSVHSSKNTKPTL